MRRLRREAGIAASVTRGVDVASWAEAFARSASDTQRSAFANIRRDFMAAHHVPVNFRVLARDDFKSVEIIADARSRQFCFLV